jgi:HTH-type transcriptional regulator/antitoxin HigA
VEAMKTSKEYLNLVQEFPLMPIKNRAEYNAAMKMSFKLGIKDYDMTPVERDYFHILDMIIHDYEKPRVKDKGAASPQELLKYLMEEHNFKQADIARIIGHESHVSAFFAKKRNLSKTEAIKLGNYFAIDPMALLPPVLRKVG